jgi:hypothetical protein
MAGRRAEKLPCQFAAIVVIVVQTLTEAQMRYVALFTSYFYFSHSSPEAVE